MLLEWLFAHVVLVEKDDSLIIRWGTGFVPFFNGGFGVVPRVSPQNQKYDTPYMVLMKRSTEYETFVFTADHQTRFGGGGG